MLRSAATTTTGARPRSATFEVAWKAMSSRQDLQDRQSLDDRESSVGHGAVDDEEDDGRRGRRR